MLINDIRRYVANLSESGKSEILINLIMNPGNAEQTINFIREYCEEYSVKYPEKY